MHKLFSQLVNTGVRYQSEKHLQNKVVLTNVTALILSLGVALPFIIISYLYFKPLIAIPSVGVVIIFSTILLNFFNLIYVSRVILSIIPLCLAAAYNGFLSHEGEPPVIGIYMIELSFAAIPLIIFDMKEKLFFILTPIFCIVILLAYDPINVLLEIEMESDIIKTGMLSNVSISIGVIAFLGIVLTLVNQGRISEKKSEELVLKSEQDRQTIIESERQLKDNLEKVKEAQASERHRQWVAEGSSEIAKILRNSSDLENVCDNIIKYLVEYTGANQGAIFLLEEVPQKILRSMATYAYGRKKFIGKEISIGQGLIGQAFLEGEHIYLTKIPEGYVNITSGLGESTPRALLIMPMKVDEGVQGIIEIASFTGIKNYQLDFIEKAAESLAASVKTIRVNDQTKSLLEQSQEQAEILRAQEEEMRQNAEEMKATQEELARQKDEMEKEIKQLKKVLMQYASQN